jgi:hypothetical protein
MRRLITYLRPYKPQVALATAAIIGHSALELAPPYLVKLVIDRYIPARDFNGLSLVAALYLATLAGSFVLDYAQTWVLQFTGQRIMFDMRMQIYEHLQRLDLKFYDRNPVGRLMTRVTTDVDVPQRPVHVWRRLGVWGSVHARRHHGHDDLARLAPGDRRVLGIAADLDRHTVVSTECTRIVPHGAYLDRAHQRVSAGANHRDGDRPAVPA